MQPCIRFHRKKTNKNLGFYTFRIRATYFYFTEPCHENLPEIPVVLSVEIGTGAELHSSLPGLLPRPHATRPEQKLQSLQQAEELPVVLITFSFRYQAVQLIDQLSFHLDEEAIGYRLAVHVEDKSSKH